MSKVVLVTLSILVIIAGAFTLIPILSVADVPKWYSWLEIVIGAFALIIAISEIKSKKPQDKSIMK